MDEELSTKIVVIDNDSYTQEELDYLLRQRGYQVISLRRGEGALKLVKAEKPHMVIMDVVLPDADGVDVFKQIKNDWDCRKVKMVVFTEYPSRIDHTIEGKIKAVFIKQRPFDDWDRLVDTVHREMQTPGED